MAEKLTADTMKTTEPPSAGRIRLVDEEVQGLSLRISASGLRSWLIQYRPKGGCQRYEVPGTFDRNSKESMSLSAARQRARDVVAAAKRGIDLPAREREEAAERERAAAAAASARTVRDLATAYLKRCEEYHRRPRDTVLRINNHVLPAIGDRLVSTIKRADVIELLDAIERKKNPRRKGAMMRQQVNRTRTTLSGMFAYAVEREHEYGIAENPVAGTRSRKFESERARVLTDAELKAVWAALGDLPEPGRSFVRTLMLTGVRRDEARLMEWREVDLDNARWLLPAARNKSGHDFEIPLSRQMVDRLKAMSRIGPLVFTVNAKGAKPFGTHGPFKTDIDAKSGVTGWVFHDLRRTLRSRLADLRIPYEVAERCLNHAIGKIERTYNRHAYTEEKASALQAWADRLMLIVGEAGGDNVTVLRASA